MKLFLEKFTQQKSRNSHKYDVYKYKTTAVMSNHLKHLSGSLAHRICKQELFRLWNKSFPKGYSSEI